jgi:hypothetical protein
MIEIQQTIDIPANRRLSLELPKSVPSGKSSVRLFFTPAWTATQVSKKSHYNPPLLLADAKAVIAERIRRKEGGEIIEDSTRTYAGCLAGKNIFKGDPVEIQRRMRDEWDFFRP